jgi:hypothetical protein
LQAGTAGWGFLAGAKILLVHFFRAQFVDEIAKDANVSDAQEAPHPAPQPSGVDETPQILPQFLRLVPSVHHTFHREFGAWNLYRQGGRQVFIGESRPSALFALLPEGLLILPEGLLILFALLREGLLILCAADLVHLTDIYTSCEKRPWACGFGFALLGTTRLVPSRAGREDH